MGFRKFAKCLNYLQISTGEEAMVQKSPNLIKYLEFTFFLAKTIAPHNKSFPSLNQWHQQNQAKRVKSIIYSQFKDDNNKLLAPKTRIVYCLLYDEKGSSDRDELDQKRLLYERIEYQHLKKFPL